MATALTLQDLLHVETKTQLAARISQGEHKTLTQVTQLVDSVTSYLSVKYVVEDRINGEKDSYTSIEGALKRYNAI